MNSYDYYYFLFLIIYLVRITKVLRETDKDTKFPWRKTTFIGMDLVYGASGLVIMVLTKLRDEPEVFGIIVLIYIAFLFLAFTADSVQEKYGDKAATKMHMLLIVLVLVTTQIAILRVSQPNSACKVIIPYRDSSLMTITGYDKFKSTYFVKIIPVKSSTDSDERIKAIAMDSFWNIVTPIKAKDSSLSKKNRLKAKDAKEVSQNTDAEEDRYKKEKIEPDDPEIMIIRSGGMHN